MRSVFLNLLGELNQSELLNLGDLGSGLVAQGAAAPVLADLVVSIIVVSFDHFDQLVKIALVTGLNLNIDILKS